MILTESGMVGVHYLGLGVGFAGEDHFQGVQGTVFGAQPFPPGVHEGQCERAGVFGFQKHGVVVVFVGDVEQNVPNFGFYDRPGHGERFGHSLGHAIGLDNHEAPLLSPFNETVLEPGMVTTVEPGIYVPGRGGVRIEDTVVVTATGYENLTSSPKELIEL